MRAAFDHVCERHGTPFSRSIGLWHCEEACFEQFHIDPVVHYQEAVKYEGNGYRTIKWNWAYKTNTVSVHDIFYRCTVGAEDYYSALYLYLEETGEGVKTIHKMRRYGPSWSNAEVHDDTLTYQGHPVDTGEQVVTLLYHIGDMPCHQ